MEHRAQMTNVLSELTENHHRRHQYRKPINEDCYKNKRTKVLRELTKKQHHFDSQQQ